MRFKEPLQEDQRFILIVNCQAFRDKLKERIDSIAMMFARPELRRLRENPLTAPQFMLLDQMTIARENVHKYIMLHEASRTEYWFMFNMRKLRGFNDFEFEIPLIKKKMNIDMSFINEGKVEKVIRDCVFKDMKIGKDGASIDRVIEEIEIEE